MSPRFFFYRFLLPAPLKRWRRMFWPLSRPKTQPPKTTSRKFSVGRQLLSMKTIPIFFLQRAKKCKFGTTAVKRQCSDRYEIWALINHEIYYIKLGLTSGSFQMETEQGIGVGPTPRGSQCTWVSSTLSWKWPRAILSPSFGHFFERNHSFRVKLV